MKKGLLLYLALLLSVSASTQNIEGFIINQMNTYPKSRLLDIYKSCFQDFMGADHLVPDKQRVKAYLDEELNTTSLDDLMPWYYEPCGIDSCYFRVSIRAVKESIITEDQLLDAFIRSANSETKPSVESWSERWHKIIGTIDSIFVRHDSTIRASTMVLAAPSVDQMKLDLPNYQEDKQFIDSVLSVGKYAISHSPDYREAYRPHYRIVERSIFEKEIKPMIERRTKK
jgi:hypothetical protein